MDVTYSVIKSKTYRISEGNSQTGEYDYSYIGEIPAYVRELWPLSVTASVILTNERKSHIVSHHKDIEDSIPIAGDVIQDPDEVHRDKKDPNMAIFYRRINDRLLVRIALWISNDPAKMNSIHSMRLSKKNEFLTGIETGRRVYIK